MDFLRKTKFIRVRSGPLATALLATHFEHGVPMEEIEGMAARPEKPVLQHRCYGSSCRMDEQNDASGHGQRTVATFAGGAAVALTVTFVRSAALSKVSNPESANPTRSRAKVTKWRK